jgi:tonB-dependent receptor plug
LVSEDLRNNTWTATNTSAKYPMMMYANPNGDSYTYGASIGSWAYTDMSLFDASYLSVKNITVGYNFPQKWMDKIGIGGIRVYASLDNMWLITSKSGIDPRQSLVGGMEVGAMGYPQMRTCSLGVNITF